MRLPFTVEQFFDVFEAYNRAIWPAQVLAYVLGLAAIVLASGDTARRGRNQDNMEIRKPGMERIRGFLIS